MHEDINTSFSEFRRCETSGGDQKREELSQPKTYQSLLCQKLLEVPHFLILLHTTHDSKAKPNNEYLSKTTKTQFKE